MKVNWEESDIRCGRRVKVPGRNEEFILGYLPDQDPQAYAMVSLLDGMVIQVPSKKVLADRLNDSCYMPCELVAK